VFSPNLGKVKAEHNDLLPYLIINLKCSPVSHHTQYKLSICTNLPTCDALFRYMGKVKTNHKHLCTQLTTEPLNVTTHATSTAGNTKITDRLCSLNLWNKKQNYCNLTHRYELKKWK